ncbi:hypothetical protein [Sneathiella glossodoripedis]|uniref:hypothetical protein n=1 Tax=Sneathiella glossodoripedis TaxID=418853 RepID=UPI00046FDF16|nr:hypothetical protein [Sneathiella glossodoripedis]
MSSFKTTEQSASFNSLLEEGSEKLVWITPKAPLSFRFTWEKVQFTGKLSKTGSEHRLLLLGDMGPLPFSAEDPGFRERLLKLVSWKPAERIKFVMEPQRQRIYMMIDDIIKRELTGQILIASAVASLFHARPFMELAKEIGWQHPADDPKLSPNIVPKAVVELD